MNKIFTCSHCGSSFESLAPPAETRDEDPKPLCISCERMLDDVDAGPLDDETIERIIAKVLDIAL